VRALWVLTVLAGCVGAAEVDDAPPEAVRGGRDGQPIVIPNTDVEDTPDNRAVLAFAEQYRQAVEAMDVDALSAMAADDYLDDAGTPTGEDDIDAVQLRALLASWAESLSDVRYEIRYRRVVRTRDRILVDFTYTGSFRLAEGWAQRVADNRLVLRETYDGFEILSGM
jgi:hypothetical protein